ncbi:hypothetical protein [Roseibium aggregatum]|uniref:hypothetical protein n=1 Tax=Roseibium aggregatum TaxID=187304 RepID=UPI001E5A1237|nr:hypothetical protein [Roseibium aggregatum]UES51571.1 hypothetical protein GFK88_19305 [Roseibium aggregatum]
MSVIESAKAHLTRLGRKCIEVPEWGPKGAPFLVYATPMTVGEREKIRQIGNAGSPEMFVDVLINKATDKEGQKLFTIDDRFDLTNKVDGSVVSRVALEILAGLSDEDLEKNLEAAGD